MGTHEAKGKWVVAKTASWFKDLYVINRESKHIYNLKPNCKGRDVTGIIRNIWEEDRCKGLEGRVVRDMYTIMMLNKGEQIGTWCDVLYQTDSLRELTEYLILTRKAA